MRFEHQNFLWLVLIATLALIAFFWWAWRKKQRLIAQFVRSRLLAHLTVGISGGRQKARMALLVGAVTLGMLALARPQWGFDWEEARQRGLDIIVAIDTSRSMLAADIRPNRLTRAKLAALDLKRLAHSDRVALVAFAGSAFLQSPLSFDDEAFRQSVNALDVNIIPVGGSAIAEAIDTARAAFKERNDNYKILVLFTDGEDNDGRAVETAERAAKDGMRIFTIGVGTPNGELLRISDGKGRADYVRDEQGNVIKSRLNEELLQKIARASQGYYMLLGNPEDLKALYNNALAPLPKTEYSSRRIQRFHERYQWLLGAVIVLLCVEMLLPEKRRVRRVVPQAPPATLARAAAVALLALLPGTVFGSASSALKQYQGGKYDRALREYERLLRDKPNEPALHYNAGAAAFQAKEYDKAITHFGSAISGQDLQLQQRALYNLGNAYYRAGEAASDPQGKISAWQEALKSFENARKLDANDADAEFNYELVKKKLEELKQQQQQQQKNQDKSDDKKDENKDDKQKDQQQQQKDQNQDQSKQDQKQDEQKDQQQKDQKEQQEQEKRDSEKQDKSQQQKPEQGQKQDQQEQKDVQGKPTRQQQVQMTPEQAQRLLEAAKNDEKVLIFMPQVRTNRSRGVLKDW